MNAEAPRVAVHAGSDELEASRLRNALTAWFVQEALPGWWRHGTDHVGGGFYELRDRLGVAVEAPRRTRVVARQSYVFSVGLELGWNGPARQAIEHGIRFLLHRQRIPGGYYAAAVEPSGALVDRRFDLYEQAFALFGLAAAKRAGTRGFELATEARALLACLRQNYRHPLGGFEEDRPPRIPLRSNPHMHLLEAALAWAELSRGEAQRDWLLLVDEIADLCVTRFIDPILGAVREYFDHQWRAMPDDSGCVIEPGHQFEWGWLLMRYGERRSRSDFIRAAQRLIELGEQYGVDPSRGLAVDEIRDDLRITNRNSKLWPQTERVKAWCAVATAAKSAAERTRAYERLVHALRGLRQYLIPESEGLWHEVIDASGAPRPGHCRASSLYHIACAIEVLTRVNPGYALQ